MYTRKVDKIGPSIAINDAVCSALLGVHAKEVYSLFCYLSAAVTSVKDSFIGYGEIEVGENS